MRERVWRVWSSRRREACERRERERDKVDNLEWSQIRRVSNLAPRPSRSLLYFNRICYLRRASVTLTHFRPLSLSPPPPWLCSPVDLLINLDYVAKELIARNCITRDTFIFCTTNNPADHRAWTVDPKNTGYYYTISIYTMTFKLLLVYRCILVVCALMHSRALTLRPL